MKRLLVFTLLFPPLVLVVFNVPDVIMHHDFKLLGLTWFAVTYPVAIIPALVLAAVDWKFHSVAKTTIAGATLAYLAAASIGFPFLDAASTLMVGLTGGVPAAVCSWLSRERK